MDRGAFIPSDTAQRTTLSAALDRYAEEVFPTLCGGGKFLRSNLERLHESLGALSLAALDASHISQFRDQCLKIGLAPQTVKHALGLLNRVLKTASIDWGIHLPRGLPTTLVRKPKLPNGRDRRLKSGEEEKLLKAARAYGGELMDIISFALETAMRREEIANMRWEHVNLKRRVTLHQIRKIKSHGGCRSPLARCRSSRPAAGILDRCGPCGRTPSPMPSAGSALVPSWEICTSTTFDTKPHRGCSRKD